MRHRKIFFVIGLLAAVCLLFNRCARNKNEIGDDPRGPQYAGSNTCGSCHKGMSDSYAHTNHFKTSGKVEGSLLGSYINPSNNAGYYADSSMVKLEKVHEQFYQTHFRNGKSIRSEKIEFAIGSAEKAQTYAYWKEGQLMQLPLTYFSSQNTWTNSPGYPIAKPYFDRVILSRCFECHASYVEKTDVQTASLQVSEKLADNTIIPGIDCERCHGPAAAHVAYQQKNPAVKEAKYITPIRSLTRQQQLDLCSTCHSGNDIDVQRSLFAFQPGDTLANFYMPHFGAGKPDPDVHGKQMQLLRQSKCFMNSQMTCGTCHNTHLTERDAKIFVTKCMACHQTSKHAMQQQTATKTCIDCHMPLQESKALDFNNGKERKSIAYLLRTHRIAVYSVTETSH
jgi:hypothetical protein